MEISRIALRALARPQSLVALGLLLLNDHVLKDLFPGAITGKLSDFAGLAFFPLLLAVVLGPLLRKPGPTLLVSSLITGICFTAIKAIPEAAATAEGLMASVWPWRITVDPTDLIALPAIAMAAIAWRNAQALPLPPWSVTRHVPDPQVAVLIVAAVASLATSCGGSDGVRFVERDGNLVVAASTFGGYISASVDGGHSWIMGIVPSQESGELERERVTEGCFVDSPDHCFRIDGGPYVEQSLDGGASWTVAWQLPPGRQRFLERSGSSCDAYIVSAVDLFITEPPDSLVLVAMSDDGLLRLSSTGAWERDILGTAAPLAATNEHIVQEYFAAIALMLSATLVLTLKAHRVLSTDTGRGIGAWPVAGSVALGFAAVLGGLRALMPEEPFVIPAFTFGVILLGLVGLAGPVAVWSSVYATRPGTTRKLSLLSATGIIALGAAVLIPFVAWSGGDIARWETALITAGVGTAVTLAITWWGFSRVASIEEPISVEKHREQEESAVPYTPPWGAAALALVGILAVGLAIAQSINLATPLFVAAGAFAVFYAAKWSGHRKPAVVTVFALATLVAPLGAYGVGALALRPPNRLAIILRIVLIIPVMVVSRVFPLLFVSFVTPFLIVGLDWLTVRFRSRSK